MTTFGLKQKFTTKKGNLIEIFSCDMKGKHAKYGIKVNGKQQPGFVNYSQLIKLMEK